jgi:AmmeMemoRadiSam system protein B
MTLDGASFPTDPQRAAEHLQRFVNALPNAGSSASAPAIRGLISPHIDYQRGGPVYAEVWSKAARASREADLVVILGTDHQGSDGALTLTRQSYATPWGVLPTDIDVVDMIAGTLGDDAAFAEELNHRSEHSIELAAVWLHFVRGGEPVPVLPILCGSFGSFVSGRADPAKHRPFQVLQVALQEVFETRRTLVVAAADLAHMGPAFGDPYGLDYIGRGQLRSADQRLLSTIYAGDHFGFFENLKAEGDRRHVCGLPPIYLTLRLLDQVSGEPAGYDLCPADPQGTSLVTIAGVLLR